VWADETPQVLPAVTVILPPVAPAIAEIELEVEVPDHPEGSVHVYDVAPLTGVIEYMFDVPWHIVALPEMVPGVAGTEFTVTAKVCAGEEPHVLFAVTVIFPLVEFAVAAILVVVEVPAHPEGKFHV